MDKLAEIKERVERAIEDLENVGRSGYYPFDDMAFYDVPGMFIPDHDEVHVCCVFTWDKERAEELRFQWQGYTDNKSRYM
jgi:hypothetical protein